MKTQFSKMVLGTVQFGLNYGIANTSGQVPFDEVKRILKSACDHGITTLDTAAAYGVSEKILGRALKETGLTSHMQVISKVSPTPQGTDPERHIRQCISQSFENLGLETLPLVLLHTEDDADKLPIMDQLVSEGVIGAAGISIDSQAYPRIAATADAMQFPCNLLDHRFDELRANRCAQGKHNFFRSAYLQGLLAMPEERIPAALSELIPWRRKLEAFGEPLKRLALRYAISVPGPNSVLFGVDSLAQLEENAAIAELGPLPDDVMRNLSAAVPLLEERLIRPHCWPKH